MTKKCPDCGKVDIDDKYLRCAQCHQKMKDEHGDPMLEVVGALKDMQKQMQFLNWNLGAISCVLRKDKKTLKKIDKDMADAENGDNDGQQGHQ